MDNELMLIKPSKDYLDELKAYREEFLNNGDSMDGCGPLREYDYMNEDLEMTNRYLKLETLPKGMIIATQFLCVRKSDNKLVGMIQIRHYFNE